MSYRTKDQKRILDSINNLFSPRYNELTTQDDSTHQLLPKDSSFLTKEGYEAPSKFRRRLSSFGEMYGKGTMKVSYRKRRFILPYILIVTLFSLGMTARFFVIQSRKLDITFEEFSFGSHINNSTCCSRTSSYLPSDLSAIQSHEPFQDVNVLERWIAEGEIHSNVDFSKYTRIDGITTWVNGTDPRHRENRIIFGQDEQRINEEKLIMKAIKEEQKDEINNDAIQRSESRFRDMNELQYHIRASRKSLEDYLGTHHIVSTDFWKSQRIGKNIQDDTFGHHHGQIPQWLNINSPFVALSNARKSSHFSVPAIRLHHDSQAFIPFDRSTKVEQWKSERLPTFNSMAIESVIGLNMPGLSQIYFLSSDDMFFTQKMTIGDFYSPLFGPIMQITHGAYSKGDSIQPLPTSELASMDYSIKLLRNRFGTPGFGYITHLQKSIVQPLMEESRIIWRNEFEEATSKRFRGDGLMANSHILTYAMTIERHREALLWSFLIARIDRDGDGLLNEEELKRTLEEIGASDTSSTVSVKLPKRTTIEPDLQNSVSKQVQFPTPKVITSLFSSFDGYAYAEPSEEFTLETGKQFSDMPISMLPLTEEGQNKVFSTHFCQIKLSFCWPRDNESIPILRTEEIFKRFTFKERGCGDCLIMHLVSKSGKRGLNAFLPEKIQEFPKEAISISRNVNKLKQMTDAFHLPLTTSFRQTNFSLSHVAIDNKIGLSSTTKTPNLRTFAMHLFLRYNYSIGTAPGIFESLQTPELAREQLERVREQVKGDIAFLCLNDDIISDAQIVKLQLDQFFQDVWPSNQTRLPFEKTM